MKISTKGRYALRVMLDLAQTGTDKFIPLNEISERQEISIKYLEMIISMLCRAGFVSSLRGKNGGYKLAKPPKEYTVGSILKVAEGSLSPVSCVEGAGNACARLVYCRTFPMWSKLNKIIDDYLESVTLDDLLNNYAG